MNDEYRLTPLQPSLSSCQLTGRTEYSETSTASFYIIITPRHHRAEVLSDDARLMSVCLSVAYIGPKSRTERPRKTEIGTEVDNVTRD